MNSSSHPYGLGVPATRLLCLAAVALLSGCGREGDSFNRLRIVPEAVDVAVGGTPVLFEGIGRATGVVTWKLKGPGVLDVTTGRIVAYTPPSLPTTAGAELTVFDETSNPSTPISSASIRFP